MRHKPDVSYYARAGYAGSQGYTMAIWTGDQVINWSYDDGLPSVIPGALNLGFCGCPFIGPDIAGYFHSDGHPSIVSEELWIRWLQLGALCPIMRDLVAYYPIELWTSERTLEAFRTYARLHMSLVPYLYSYAAKAHRTGRPIMRHLYLAYPDDENARDLSYQFLLGEELLVAPVLAPGVEQWRVYLPEGEWISWWDGTSYPGPGWIDEPAPLMRIPLFVKAGAIIPRLSDDIDTLVPATDAAIRVANDDLEIDVFPSRTPLVSAFQLGDGTRLSWDLESLQFNVESSPVVRTYTFRFRQFDAADEVRAIPSALDVSEPAGQHEWDDADVYMCRFTGRDVNFTLHVPR